MNGNAMEKKQKQNTNEMLHAKIQYNIDNKHLRVEMGVGTD